MKRGVLCLFSICVTCVAPAAGIASGDVGLPLEQATRLSLEEATARAIAASPRMAAARARLDAELARQGEVWTFAPMEFGFERRGVPDFITGEPFEFQKVGLRQRFDFPTLYGMRSRQHTGLVESARRMAELEELAIVTEVKTAYVDALRARRGLELARENLALSAGLLEKAELRFKVGEEGRREFLWARLQRNRAENAVLAANVRSNETGERLAAIVAIDSESLAGGLEPTDPLEFRPVDLGALGLDGARLEEHPRIRAHASSVRAATDGVRLASASLLPDIHVGVFRQELRNITGVWGLEVGFSIPAFSWRGRQARVAVSKALLAQAESAREDDSLRLRADMRSAVTAVREADRQVRRFEEEILHEAAEVFRLAEISYREGETSYIDLLLAQQFLVETRSEYLDALADHVRAVARLELALGRRL
jgi:outer membrane protein TolC